MSIVIVRDVHANLPALDAVMPEIQQNAFEVVYRLGDLVGYMFRLPAV